MGDVEAHSQMREILDIVSRSHAPVMVLEVPSQIIAAASPGAHELLDHIAQPLLGRSLHEFVDGAPTDAMSLLAAGRITGYETMRVIRGTGQRRRLWIQSLPRTGSLGAVIAVLLKDDDAGRVSVPWEVDDAPTPVIGSTDARLMIDRVSSEVLHTLGYQVAQLIGTSILALVAPEDVPKLLGALAETSQNNEGVTLRVGLINAELVSVSCQLVLLPLTPAPSCAFALLTEQSDSGPADGRAVAEMITRLGQGIRGAMTSQAAATTPLRPDVDLTHLSSRELSVVMSLMAGHRVAAIAKLEFLSEGTIRNHLSIVFAKLGVKTQRELIELLRPVPPRDLDR